jgi:predicted NBD/HSP70 family sugar kinase
MEGEGLYAGVDVGGTKTLVALFSKSGQILQQLKFPTPKSYPKFLKELKSTLDELVTGRQTTVICIAAPGLLDRGRGIGLEFGNLPWRNVKLVADIQKLVPDAEVLIENDSNLAGLSEALLVQDKYKKVLYLTISTGIGDGIIVRGIIDPDFANSEPGHMVLEHDGKLTKWEDFASGRALVAQTGKLAERITDEKVWYRFSKYLAQGIDPLVAAVKPDVIIIGGGVGSYFERFGHFLAHELKKYENNMVKMPPIIKAKRPEEAVIYGCYDYIRQNTH